MTVLEESPITFGDDWSDDLKLELEANKRNGRVGMDLLSETDDVRVWGISIALGQRVGFHCHVLNYFWVAINPGKSRSRYATGETLDYEYVAGMTRHFNFAKGEFMLHDLENIGDTELKFTTVEFKNSPNTPLPI